MKLILDNFSVVIFDLDDTLYKEINFLKSAFYEIASKVRYKPLVDVYNKMITLYFNAQDVFDYLLKNYSDIFKDKNELLFLYRNHIPDIQLVSGAKEILESLHKQNIKLGLITDGRSITQRNKINALGIANLFNDIIISEEVGTRKPSLENYIYFEKKYSCHNFTYIADNLEKDFIIPNQLDWNSICIIDSGENIHKQNFELPDENLPKNIIKTMYDLEIIYEE